MKELLQTVVVAVSGSEASINAAKYAIALAKGYRSRILAVYVVDTATLRELIFSRIFIEEESAEYEKSLEQNGHRYLNYVEELASKKGVRVEKILRRGTISTEIVEVAEDNRAGLILLDALSRQHREIMKNARCSILVVKEPEMDALFKKL